MTKLSTFEGDIRDSDLLKKVCKGASIVFHAASLIDVTGAINYSELYGVNVTGEGFFLIRHVFSLVFIYSLVYYEHKPKGVGLCSF